MIIENDLKRSTFEKWATGLMIIAPAIATPYAIYHLLATHQITWKEPALFLAFYWLTGFGITIGYHRLLTHRSFEANPIVRFIFIALGVMAYEGMPQRWAAVHLLHHKHTDEELDPHSPLHGFWHAHLGWMIGDYKASAQRYGAWMDNDRMIQFFNKTTVFWMILRLLIPYVIDGWQGFIWGGLVALFWTHHSTWSVNSAAHMFGRRDFDTEDHSTNLWWVGMLALGEGWHNGHHAFPWSARHGLLKRQFDPSYQLIMLMERIGLVRNVKQPTPEDILAKRVHYTPLIPVEVQGPEVDAVDGAVNTAWPDSTEQIRHEMIKAL
jgi:stearoyl-CoA desaturase (Delta-9 desaturase)